jgi:hypothetical protein
MIVVAREPERKPLMKGRAWRTAGRWKKSWVSDAGDMAGGFIAALFEFVGGDTSSRRVVPAASGVSAMLLSCSEFEEQNPELLITVSTFHMSASDTNAQDYLEQIRALCARSLQTSF